MDKIKNILAVVACLGIAGLIIGGFNGNFLTYLIFFPLLILIIIILYIFSFVRTLIDLYKSGYKNNSIKVIVHTVTLVLIIVYNLYDSELFKSKKVLAATLTDDLFSYTIILRKDGSCENYVRGFLGTDKKFSGQYYRKGDTIIFTKVPYDTGNFIPDTVLLDRKANAIFIERDSTGKFQREKGYLNHFEINP